MRQILNKPRFVAALAALSILLAVWRLGHFSARFSAEVPGPAVDLATGLAAAAGPEISTGAPSIEAMLRGLPSAAAARDPFAPRLRAPTKLEKKPLPEWVDAVHVSALWTEHAATLALINGRICAPGDLIGHLRIAATGRDGVWVTHGGQRDFIPMGGDATLRTPIAPNPTPVALN